MAASTAVVGLAGTVAHAAGPSVSVWETTADRSQLLSPQAGATFQPGGGSAGQTITVNPGTTYQSMAGFGASFTDSSAWLVANSPQRNTIMTNLFDPSQGIGLSFLRQPIGASDFARSVYSYDEGGSDPSLSNFSIAHDNAYILPILQQARQINPAITIMGTPWSPPAWMKTNGNMIGGTLNSANNQVYANYFVKYLQAYKNAGVPVNLVTPQNEPEYSPSSYPGSTWSSTDEASFIQNNLGPAIQNAGLSTKIIGYDHNWDDPGYPTTVLNNAAQYTAGIAWHCYGGNVSAQTQVHNSFPSKDAYFTECSGIKSNPDANTFSDSLMWQTENLIIGATRNWAKSVVTWNMALDPSGGPTMGCNTCAGVVTVDNGSNNVTYNAEYYGLGQASKFVTPGAVRVDSNTFGANNLEDVAFVNPNGSHALLVQNADSNSRTFNVNESGQFFTYTLPGRSVATFVWTPGGIDTQSPTTPTNLAVSNPTSSSLTLNWTASTDNVGVTGYNVFRNGVKVGTSTTNSYQDTGLAAQTSYSYTVSAYDAASNTSGLSGAASGTTTTGGDGTKPTVPTNLAVSNPTSSSLSLNWTASTDNVGVTGYNVLRNGTKVGTSTTTSYTDTGLTASTAYTYTVSAYDAAGNTSAASAPASGTTSGGNGGPIDPTKWYQVVNVNSHKCVDAVNGGTGNGTGLQQWTCSAANHNQHWQFQPTDSGFYKVVTRNATTLGWDVSGGAGSTGNGVAIQLWTYGGGTNQQWKPVAHTDGSMSFTPRNNTGECLDVTNVSTADGARLQQWACNNGAAQSFTLTAQP